MDEEQIELEPTEAAEETEAPEVEPEPEEEPAVEKPKENLDQKRARLQRELKQTEKKLGLADEKPDAVPGELNDDQLDYLDLKGISAQEDIDLIERVMKRTGEPLRNVLKDDYVTEKLKANKAERDVKSATPSSSKRGSAGGPTIDALVAKAERDITSIESLDFETQTKVINALTSKNDPHTPPYRR